MQPKTQLGGWLGFSEPCLIIESWSWKLAKILVFGFFTFSAASQGFSDLYVCGIESGEACAES